MQRILSMPDAVVPDAVNGDDSLEAPERERAWTHLCQVALTVRDMEASLGFYERVLGYRLNSRMPAPMSQGIFGIISALQGHPGTRASAAWISDRTPRFQLEMFEYDHPEYRPMRDDAAPNDHGYSRLSVHVQDFDGTLRAAQQAGAPQVTEPEDFGDGCGRRACIRDPDGIFIELLEHDPAAASADPAGDVSYALGARTRAITLSVPDLEVARDYFEGVLGMSPCAEPFHTAAMERLWGLEGAQTRGVCLDGGDVVLELVQYVTPAGRPFAPGHTNADAGLFHIAFRMKGMQALAETYDRTCEAGHHPHSYPFFFFVVNAVYLRTDQGFTVEYMDYPACLGGTLGFKPLPFA